MHRRFPITQPPPPSTSHSIGWLRGLGQFSAAVQTLSTAIDIRASPTVRRAPLLALCQLAWRQPRRGGGGQIHSWPPPMNGSLATAAAAPGVASGDGPAVSARSAYRYAPNGPRDDLNINGKTWKRQRAGEQCKRWKKTRENVKSEKTYENVRISMKKLNIGRNRVTKSNMRLPQWTISWPPPGPI